MREIKFRAWNIESKVMVYFDFYDIQLNLFSIRELALKRNDALSKNEYVNPIMQYTGLKDKNGKEIYEGYIVTFRGGYGHHYVVEYEGSSFVHVTGCPFTSQDPIGTESDIEVIGNKYENPELLEMAS